MTYIQRLLKEGLPAPLFGEVNLSKLDFSIEEKRFETYRKDVIYNVKLLYYGLIGAKKNMQLDESILNIAVDILKIREKEMELGLITKWDKFKSETDVSKAEVSLLKQQDMFRQKRRLLTDTLGLERCEDIDFEDVRQITFPVANEAEIMIAVQNSSEIREIEESVEKSKLEVRMADNRKLPELNFMAEYKRKEEAETFGSAHLFHVSLRHLLCRKGTS